MTGGDPIRERRAWVARVASGARRLGFSLFVLATAILGAGLATTFTDAVARTVTALLVAGSVVLVPAIILGYATRAAERQDRERGL